MMTKTFAGVCVWVLITCTASAQKIAQSIGIGDNISLANTYAPSPPPVVGYAVRQNQLGIVYFPRVPVFKTNKVSLTIGAPLNIGVSWNTKYDIASVMYFAYSSYSIMYTTYTKSVDNKVHFATEIPVVADLNVGLGADKHNKKIGGYIGAGGAYSSSSFRIFDSKVPVESYNLYLHAGIRFKAMHEVLSVGLSYKTNQQLGMQVLRDF